MSHMTVAVRLNCTVHATSSGLLCCSLIFTALPDDFWWLDAIYRLFIVLQQTQVRSALQQQTHHQLFSVLVSSVLSLNSPQETGPFFYQITGPLLFLINIFEEKSAFLFNSFTKLCYDTLQLQHTFKSKIQHKDVFIF